MSLATSSVCELALLFGLGAVIAVCTPAIAVTAQEKLNTCTFGADFQKLKGKPRDAFIKRCMADDDPAEGARQPQTTGRTQPPPVVRPVETPAPSTSKSATSVPPPAQAQREPSSDISHAFLIGLFLAGAALGTLRTSLRLSAKRINAVALSFPDETRRRFGMWPGNLYEYEQGIGWTRVLGRSWHGTSIPDLMDNEARVRREREMKWRRRTDIAVLAAVLAILLGIIKLLIYPLPLAAFMNILSIDGFVRIYATVLVNIVNVVSYVLGIENGFLRLLLALFALSIPITMVLIGWRSALAAFVRFGPAVYWEIMYLLGFQWVDGAMVFDASPNELLIAARNHRERRSDRDTEGEERARRAQQERASRTHQQRSERPPPHEPNPAKNLKDAIELFGLDEHSFTYDDLNAAWKKIAKKYHPDPYQGLAEELLDAAQEKLKTINAAHDLIKRWKGWK